MVIEGATMFYKSVVLSNVGISLKTMYLSSLVNCIVLYTCRSLIESVVVSQNISIILWIHLYGFC